MNGGHRTLNGMVTRKRFPVIAATAFELNIERDV